MGIKEVKASQGYRLVNTKYPPISLFDDVADAEDFDKLYAIQAMTNPRLRDEVGDVTLIAPDEIPYQCQRGRSFAIAPFTHINPSGGRFSDGLFGALYIASTEQTAALEVRHHQQQYWQNVEGLSYDRFLFRGLIVTHQAAPIYHIDTAQETVLNPSSYIDSQQLARELKQQDFQAVHYPSVRDENGECWALFTPKPVSDVVQSYLLEMIWDGDSISEVNKVDHLCL